MQFNLQRKNYSIILKKLYYTENYRTLINYENNYYTMEKLWSSNKFYGILVD